jgi:hypothetical protein
MATDIVKNILKGSNRLFQMTFKAASRRLLDVFGIKVEQVADKANISFILVNTIDDTPLASERPFETDVINGILIPVLAVIFMSDGEVKEDVMWSFLTTLGFNVDDKNPLPEIGVPIRELVTSVWVKQLYLQYQRVTANEITEHYFSWGFRAKRQFSKTLLLKFVCKVFGGGMTPSSWKLLNIEAQQQDK